MNKTRIQDIVASLTLAIHAVIKDDNQIGFALFVFDLKTMMAQCVTNGDRKQIFAAVREQMDKTENEAKNPRNNPFHNLQ